MARYQLYKLADRNFVTFDTDDPDQAAMVEKMEADHSYTRTWELTDEQGQYIIWGAEIKLKSNEPVIEQVEDPQLSTVSISDLIDIIKHERIEAVKALLVPEEIVLYKSPYDTDSIIAITEGRNPDQRVVVRITLVSTEDERVVSHYQLECEL